MSSMPTANSFQLKQKGNSVALILLLLLFHIQGDSGFSLWMHFQKLNACSETKIYGQHFLSILRFESLRSFILSLFFTNTSNKMVLTYLCMCVYIDCDSRAKYFNFANIIYKSYQCNAS